MLVAPTALIAFLALGVPSTAQGTAHTACSIGAYEADAVPPGLCCEASVCCGTGNTVGETCTLAVDISGTISDRSSGLGVAGAKVMINDSDFPAGFSDAAGRYSLRGSTLSTCQVEYTLQFEVQATGYVPHFERRTTAALEELHVDFTLLPFHPCSGDCNGSGHVTVAELITGVNIALGTLLVSTCPAFENAQGKVDIAQIIQGVNNALNGCPGAPTATIVSPPSTVTPTQTVKPTPTATSPGDRFVDNGDGTITDNHTGLIWEKKDHRGGLHDVDTGYLWAGVCRPTGFNAYCQPDVAAATTCNAATGGAIECAQQCPGMTTCNTGAATTIWHWLNQLNAANFAGHSDWRIPTVGWDGGELKTIVDPSSAPGCTGEGGGPGIPCVWPAFNTACTGRCAVTSCSCTQAWYYWSASTDDLITNFAWEVNFDNGNVVGVNKAYNGLVRAVRGGS